ncbi:hypothetical protein [Nonomuraea typhae]|uniref:hypothetical protein n=1 Tax=Nonomuraea typhae TaxID=2603600 RepID=UPI0012F8065A|nr:hypothetical protein [Nonomuraea typhae]
MRTLRHAAALTAALTALSLATAPAAQADDHRHGESVRYASVKGCPDKNREKRPCGPWRLVMHSGEMTLLRDAQTVARHADGTSSGYQVAPIAVSGDGRRVAYFTKQGRVAVRTLGGGVKLLAADALPRAGQYERVFNLSDDGAKLAVTTYGKQTRVFDTATGAQLGSAGRDEPVEGFSGDADEILTLADGEDSVTDLVIYRDTGEQARRVTPPQLVSGNGPHALAADGTTIANLAMGKKPALVLYDSATDQVTATPRVKLPAGGVRRIDWTGENQVTVHLALERDGRPTRMTVVQISVPSGAVKVRDRYTVLADSYVFASCGG